MIRLAVHRMKGCAALGAPAPGRAGPFGTWTWQPDDEEPDEGLTADRPTPGDESDDTRRAGDGHAAPSR